MLNAVELFGTRGFSHPQFYLHYSQEECLRILSRVSSPPQAVPLDPTRLATYAAAPSARRNSVKDLECYLDRRVKNRPPLVVPSSRHEPGLLSSSAKI